MTDVLVPGGRDVRGRLDEPDEAPAGVVVACPPHPQHGGSRSDQRLVAVSETLREAGVACLRFDYGEWDEGRGEREDVRNAVRWADDRYDRVGLFGYSFGASQALLAAADVDRPLAGVAALAPTESLGPELDATAALAHVDAPTLVLYGERDTTVNWGPVVERVRERGDETVALPADHFFLGTREEIARNVRTFFAERLGTG
ncbi:alpha/beta hydrolase [Natronococcus occultus]|uniref:Putative hydrolase of the alpha/beta superfamily n=1 Tax=Natronococcus occultus SP4 TaxID=694430 RepID=L0JU91_9EURY|nr:dienelactone hydrolase family protein [Natronococcus occultus]AGB36301.1 putative hydrolase of the alpha/beta superfamily [Natronococcus occultus SP4]